MAPTQTKTRVIQPELMFCDKAWVEGYDRIAATAMAPVFRHFAAGIKRAAPQGGRMLDVGSGSGRLFMAVEESGLRNLDYAGIDISREMALKAAGNARAVAAPGSLSEFPMATASHLPFGDGCFDIVVSSSSLHMWSDPVGVLNEIHRVLKPGALCLIRDTRRLPDNLFWRFFLTVASRSRHMSEPQRKAWMGAIQAGYTLGEAREVLRQSRLHSGKVRIDSVFFELIIEARKTT